jgi:hypothetical protein
MAYDLNNDIPLGQLGSAYIDVVKPVYPPKDMVIRAITFLEDDLSGSVELDTEILDGQGPQYFGTNSTEATAANYLGVTEAAVDSAGSSVGVITLSAANTKIKVGQYIIIGDDDDTVVLGITVDSSAGNVTPIYQGPNAQGLIVKSISSTTLTVTNADGSVFDASNLDADNTLYFLDETHGVGGVEADGAKYPKGITIYGRWVRFQPGIAAKGAICYFGH